MKNKIFDNKILLESNIRRCGEIGGSAKKVGKRIKELEKLYGIREGRSEKLPNNSVVKSLKKILQHKWECLWIHYKITRCLLI